MVITFSQEAIDRADGAVQAAELFLANAQAISLACDVVTEAEVVVAVIDRNLDFRGVCAIQLHELRASVLELEESGWSLVFSPGVSLEEIEERCRKMRHLAQLRLDGMRKLSHKYTEL